MDDNKIIKLNIDIGEENKMEQKKKARKSLFQTNPILHEMFTSNMNIKKNKFNFKDLFK